MERYHDALSEKRIPYSLQNRGRAHRKKRESKVRVECMYIKY